MKPNPLSPDISHNIINEYCLKSAFRITTKNKICRNPGKNSSSVLKKKFAKLHSLKLTGREKSTFPDHSIKTYFK